MKPGLDNSYDVSSYRPIFNLTALSKPPRRLVSYQPLHCLLYSLDSDLAIQLTPSCIASLSYICMLLIVVTKLP